jgi:4-amino-4-deoxy-L-arabinose transferase-like glycosyltransferase
MIDEQRLRPALGIVVLLAASAMVAFVAVHPIWWRDPYLYSVRMLLDTGLPLDVALHRAQAFFKQWPVAATPEGVHYFRGDQPPANWDLFRPRVVYPFVASLLYPMRGFPAMLDISAAAYVATSLAVYYLVLQFAGAFLALLVALAFVALPFTQRMAEYPSTDMLAMLFSTLCVVALVRIARGGGRGWLAFFAVIGLLLVFTRPAFYVLLGGTLGFWIGVRGGNPSLRRAALICVGIAVTCSAIYIAVVLSLGTPGFSYVIADGRSTFFSFLPQKEAQVGFLWGLKGLLHFSQDDPPRLWYAKILVLLVCREIARAVIFVFPLVAFYGLSTMRRDPAFGALAGMALALCLAVPLDPYIGDMIRVLEFPMLPVLAVGVAVAAEEAIARFSGTSGRLTGESLKKTLPGG